MDINYKCEDIFKPNKWLTSLCGIYFILSMYEIYINGLIGSITKYYMLALMFFLLISYKKIVVNNIHISIYLWMIIKLTSSLWGIWNYSSATFKLHFISQVGIIVFLMVITFIRFDKKFIEYIINICLYSSFSMGVLGLFFSKPYLGQVESRRVLTLFGIQNEPNNLAAFYLIGISIALYLIVYENKNKILNIIIIGVNTISMTLTASRGGLVSLIGIVLLIIFINKYKNNYLLEFIKKLIYFILLLSITYLILKLCLPEASFERLFDFSSYEGGSERSTLWYEALYLIKQKPLLGWGWGGYKSGIHNTYLSMICDVGIIGFMIFIYFIGLIVFKAYKSRCILSIIILATGLLPSFFIEAINKRFFWNGIILSIILINSNYKNNIVK